MSVGIFPRNEINMWIAVGVACVLFTFGIQPIESSSDFGEAIQIVTPNNHSFALELNNLQSILDIDGIKDRQVVVVSIAGALRHQIFICAGK